VNTGTRVPLRHFVLSQRPIEVEVLDLVRQDCGSDEDDTRQEYGLSDAETVPPE